MCALFQQNHNLMAPSKRKPGEMAKATKAKSAMLGDEFYECVAEIDESFRNSRAIDMSWRPHTIAKYAGYLLKLDNHRFCPNVGREHNSSTLFLRINVFGEVTAGCFCKKHGCDKWRSLKVALPQSVLKRIGLLTKRGVPLGFEMVR